MQTRRPTVPTAFISSTVLLAAAAIVLFGCAPAPVEDESDHDLRRSRPPVTAGALTTEAAGARGTAVISGFTRYEGPPPVNETFRMTADSFCAKAHPNEVTREDVLLGKDSGLANVFVWVKSGLSGTYTPPQAPVTLDQNGCTYRPHVFGAMTGQPIEIVNNDETIHNVHAVAEKNDSFNFGMPLKDLKTQKVFEQPEIMVKIKCDVHGWMSAYAGIVPHPFYSVSSPDGSYSIRDLPVGTYVVEAWHERLGTLTQTVSVTEGETKSTPFVFRAGQAAAPPPS